MVNDCQSGFKRILWLCHKKIALTQLGVQLLGCSPQRGSPLFHPYEWIAIFQSEHVFLRPFGYEVRATLHVLLVFLVDTRE